MFNITPTRDETLREQLQQRIDSKTKPLGALGRVEALMLQTGLIQRTLAPALCSPQLVVFAADHGLAAQGVSAYPAEVTWQMVHNMLAGGAAVNVLARQHNLALQVVDCGVARDFAPHPMLHTLKVAPGTHDASTGPAMTPAQCTQAVEQGAALVKALPGNVLLLGEMGIGNTSSAALLLARLAGLPLAGCVGRGTGLGDTALAHKQAVLAQVLALHAAATAPMHALAALGGFEIATMVGAVLQAAQERRVVVVDGFITGSAVLVAQALHPAVGDYCVFSHCGAEGGHAAMLRALKAEPLFDLGLRLGEGSGAAMAWPLLKSAELLLREMASFESAAVSGPAA